MDISTESELNNFIGSLVYAHGGSSSPTAVHPGVKRMLSDLGHEFINTLTSSAVRASVHTEDNGVGENEVDEKIKRRRVVKVRDFMLPISNDPECYRRAKEILDAKVDIEDALSSLNGVMALMEKEADGTWADEDTRDGAVDLLKTLKPPEKELEPVKRATRGNADAALKIWTGEAEGAGEA